MIESFTVKDIEELIFRLNDYPNNFVFRGHANSDWLLESTLERILGKNWTENSAKKHEDYSLNLFKSKYKIYKDHDHNPSSKLAWLSVMQHYGVPTRLLDFTESPYVALYFALEAYDTNSKNDLSIYAIDYASIMDSSIQFISRRDSGFRENRLSMMGRQDEIFDQVVDRFSYELVWITEPLEMNIRIDRQAGTFLLSGDPNRKVENLLASEQYEGCKVQKIIIPGRLYESIFALLRKMNVNAKSIYGDLTGLAKSIRMDMQVHAF